jgi:hypothetical protein
LFARAQDAPVGFSWIHDGVIGSCVILSCVIG